MLASPDWRIRSEAVGRLNLLPVEKLPGSYAATILPLFDHEALFSHQRGPRGDGYGEYLIHLVQAVLRINDPRSLRGMALLGIQTGRGPAEFVAQRGAEAIPYLDEAWVRDTLGRFSVVRTWGRMLGPYGHVLGRSDSIAVMVRLLRAAREQPQGFTRAAEIAQLVETLPLVERIAGAPGHDIVRRRAEQVATQLRALRDSLPAPDLARRLAIWVVAVCDASRSAGGGACGKLRTLSGDAANMIRTVGVRGADAALQALAEEGDRAFREGILDAAARELIVATAEYLKTRS